MIGSRRRRLVTTAALALVLVACGSSDDNVTKSSARARPNAVTGPDVTVVFTLTGARIVPEATQQLRPDEGHIHLYLDNQLVSMNYGLTQDLKGLSAGPHTLRAEFVAGDHGPFRNPPTAAAVFQVSPPPGS
jgi:hypothetical protein